MPGVVVLLVQVLWLLKALTIYKAGFRTLLNNGTILKINKNLMKLMLIAISMPDSLMSVGAYNATIKQLEQANGRIPDEHPQLKALLTNAAQSPDFNTLKERMNTLQTEFTQHYFTAVQMTIDTSGKAEPSAPAASVKQTETAPAQKPPAQGENVAAIEAKVKAGEVINLSDLSDAIKKDKQTAQTGQPGKTASQTGQTRPYSRGKSAATPAAKTEQPCIKQQIAAGKQQLAGQKSAPARAAAQNKNAGLGD